MTITKTQRWLDLIAFLVRNRFPATVDDVMNGVPAYRERWLHGDATQRESVRRMFERDKDELRAAGIPLETVEYTMEHGAETVQGYQLSSRDFYLPYLRIVGGRGESRGTGSMEVSVAEARTAMDALRRVAELPASPFGREARSALAKLTFDLDPEALEDPSPDASAQSGSDAPPGSAVGPGAGPAPGAGGPVLYVDTGAEEVRETLRLLTDAVRRRKRVRFRYRGIERRKETERDVAPYGLLYQHGQWYLIGHDATRDAIRVFRLTRMAEPSVGKGEVPEYEPDASFSLAEYARREPWELGEDEPVPADVRFDFPLALWAERNRQGAAVRELEGGAVVRRFGVRQPDAFLRWLQTFAGDAVVVRPPELRRAQAALARATLAAYGDAAGSDG